MDKVVAFDIPVSDMKRAKKFYERIFDWKIGAVPGSGGNFHKAITVQIDENGEPKETGAINGGLFQRGTHGLETISIEIKVPSIDEYLKKIESAGGKIVMPKGPILDIAFFSLAEDTEGNIIGLWEDVKKPESALKPEEDAYGQEIWAAYKGAEISEIVERDDGYFDASTYGPRIYFSEDHDWSAIEKEAMKFVKGRVLDIGCGAGRHSLYLQEKGHDVLGIDNSPLAIKVCKLRGLKKTKMISIEDANFKRNSFDTIIMMGNNFGLFASFEKAQILLKRFHRMTSRDALIIADTRDPYGTDNPAHLEYHRLNKKKGRMGGQVRIRIRFRKYVGKWFDYLMVSKEEMKAILKETGWKVKKFVDSNDSEYVAIIQKAAH